MLFFLFFIIAFVFWSFLHESLVGASKYKMRLKLLDNYSYYKIERESSSDAISDIQFTVLDRGGKEKEYYLSLENNQEENMPITYIDSDKNAYVEFYSYGDSSYAQEVMLYIPDKHCNNCNIEMKFYGEYCPHCGEMTDFAEYY